MRRLLLTLLPLAILPFGGDAQPRLQQVTIETTWGGHKSEVVMGRLFRQRGAKASDSRAMDGRLSTR